MTQPSTSESSRPPKHLRIVGAIALLWNAMGAFDYLMTETRNDAYMRQFSTMVHNYGLADGLAVAGSPFALAFSASVEFLNMLARRRHRRRQQAAALQHHPSQQ